MKIAGLLMGVLMGLILATDRLCAQYQGANWPLIYNYEILKITPDTFEEYQLPYPPGYVADNPIGLHDNVSVSDSEGNLLLYSFGFNIRNRYGTIVQGGAGICQSVQYPEFCDSVNEFGSDLLQGSIILPWPGHTGQYYLFNKDMYAGTDEQPTRVTATLIDAYARHDSGQVLEADSAILEDSLCLSRMTACQHGNGRDWWLINHQFHTNRIYVHLISPDGIEGPFEQDIGLPGLSPDASGWSVFSPATNTYATTTGGMGSITLLDFDRCSGTFDSLRTINTASGDSGNYYFLAFSPNGRFLYAANNNYIVQYDLLSGDTIVPYVKVVHDTAQIPLLGPMVLMPDGKIYITGWTVIDSMLSVIDSPNLKCPACDFHLRSVQVPNSLIIFYVPNFPNYNLGPVKGSACDTITGIKEITSNDKIIRLQPNPADEYVHVEMRTQGNYEFDLLNSLGQVLATKQTRQVDIFDTENLASGIYLLQVRDRNTGQAVGVRRVVVVH